MLEVTLSQQYQISTPQEIRDLLNLQAGQKFLVVLKNDAITLVPQSSIESFPGILKGVNTQNVRDRSERT